MTASDKQFTGSIPELYDTYLVPMIFDQYADDLAARVASMKPQAVLETAAGSGVVPRALAPLLGADSLYVVSDLNQAMLDRAEQMQGADNRIEWRQADALKLPFGDASFDAVVCQYGVMFYPDKVQGFSQARRVLKPGGRYIFNAWDHIGVNEFADVVTEAAAGVFPDDPPRFLARTPHGYHDVEVIKRDLQAAGFSDISIETIDKISPAPSPRHAAIAYCEGTPLRNEIESRDASLLSHVTNLATEAIAKRYGNGPVEAKIQAHVVTASG